MFNFIGLFNFIRKVSLKTQIDQNFNDNKLTKKQKRGIFGIGNNFIAQRETENKKIFLCELCAT